MAKGIGADPNAAEETEEIASFEETACAQTLVRELSIVIEPVGSIGAEMRKVQIIP